ncbi:MAG: sigma-70 family RNA polymerase sigma factor [Micropepsaceae bacterium]
METYWVPLANKSRDPATFRKLARRLIVFVTPAIVGSTSIDAPAPIMKLGSTFNTRPGDQKRFIPALTEPSTEESQAQRWQRLMKAAQAAEPRAYAEFLREATSFIRVIARRYHNDASAIEDVVQETLIAVHRMRHTYEPGRPVEPWMAAITRARAIDALRSRYRRAKIETALPGDAVNEVADSRASTESDLVSQSTIGTALASLTPAQRSAVQLLKIEELSLNEASSVSGLSVQALKSSLHRAMQSLRANLLGNDDA